MQDEYEQHDGAVTPTVALTRIGAPQEVWEPLLAALRPGAAASLTAGLPESLADDVAGFTRIALWERATIRREDGVVLDGGFWRHRDEQPRPLVVIPSAWGAPWQAFAILAFKLSLQGYNVLAYQPRGFFGSGGFIGVCGEDDWDDASAAIDWATLRTGAEPTKVGFFGDSYGAGISCIAAARDERVDAVVALSGWSDLASCMYENHTRRIRTFQALLAATKNERGETIGRFDAATQAQFDNFFAHRDMGEVMAWATPRSPVTHVEAINTRRVPLLIGGHWHETLCPVNQTLDMFQRLTGPKRLLLSIGDHSGAELLGLAGLPNRVVDEGYRWLAHHLLGEENGVDTLPEVANEVMFTYTTVPLPVPVTVPNLPPISRIIVEPAEVEERKAWADVTGSTERLHLKPASKPDFLHPEDGELSQGVAPTWERPFTAGADAGFTAAENPVTTGAAEVYGTPVTYRTRWFDRRHAAVWKTPVLPSVKSVRGVPRLHLTFTPSAASATLVAYLFDVDPVLGTARIITHEPKTFLGVTPNEPVTTDIDLQAAAYDIPAGHRLMLVLASRDQLYADASIDRTRIDVRSTAADPTYLDLPLS
ncbi:alpha/beta fold hydrolase [Streptomyces vilmorinianum]|uniref:alpha/beta fold hydrolase n=1 Tax=Streptomyces vilmorinianum TaxID=3051092 RepID=UPI0010FB7C05|nr:alpha/beta fold hydrolase [Streptomyces vilmorinianum]